MSPFRMRSGLKGGIWALPSSPRRSPLPALRTAPGTNAPCLPACLFLYLLDCAGYGYSLFPSQLVRHSSHQAYRLEVHGTDSVNVSKAEAYYVPQLMVVYAADYCRHKHDAKPR